MTAGAITDEQMLAAVAAIETEDFTVIDVAADGTSHMLVRFSITGETGLFGIRLPLPSSSALKPWLSDIPRDADDAAGMLKTFLDEEVCTGCVGWAASTTRGDDRTFKLAPYGFRHSDEAEHQRLLKSSGQDGWWGRIQESDDRAQTPGNRRVADLQQQPLTYVEIGATAGELPTGYRTVDVSRSVGRGREWFEIASQRLLSWDMHRRAGLLVGADEPVAPGVVAELEVRVGPWWVRAPVRVIGVIDEPSKVGFAYGTLPGHPEIGEERFIVRHETDDSVHAQIRAFSRPGRWFSKLGAPVARRVQDSMTRRYLSALTYNPVLDDPALDDDPA